MSIILTKGMLQTNKKGMVANHSLYTERFTCITVNMSNTNRLFSCFILKIGHVLEHMQTFSVLLFLKTLQLSFFLILPLHLLPKTGIAATICPNSKIRIAFLIADSSKSAML